MWIDREEEAYHCAVCGKELSEDDCVVMNENMPIEWQSNDNRDMYCADCVQNIFEGWLAETLEEVG